MTLETSKPGRRPWCKSVDVIVVGGGVAGFAGALAARAQGAGVLLIEKNAHFAESARMCTMPLHLRGRIQACASPAEEEDVLKQLGLSGMPEVPRNSFVIGAPRALAARAASVGMNPNEYRSLILMLRQPARLARTARGLSQALLARALERWPTSTQTTLIAQLYAASRAKGLELWHSTPLIELVIHQRRVLGAQVSYHGTRMRVEARQGVLLDSDATAERGSFAPFGRAHIGLSTDEHGRVIDAERNRIEGLYAAGGSMGSSPRMDLNAVLRGGFRAGAHAASSEPSSERLRAPQTVEALHAR